MAVPVKNTATAAPASTIDRLRANLETLAAVGSQRAQRTGSSAAAPRFLPRFGPAASAGPSFEVPQRLRACAGLQAGYGSPETAMFARSGVVNGSGAIQPRRPFSD